LVVLIVEKKQWGDDLPLADYHPANVAHKAVHFADSLFRTYRNKQNDFVHQAFMMGACAC